MSEAGKNCPSPHCERRQECASPNECVVKWDGRPEKPERDGECWLKSDDGRLLTGTWYSIGYWGGFTDGSPQNIASHFTYAGRCLTPSEVVARVQAAQVEVRPMVEASNWPDPNKPGVPENPERNGWHWIRPILGLGIDAPKNWLSRIERWELSDGTFAFPHECSLRWRYLGPCLTPSEVAARVQASYREGWNDRESELLEGYKRIGHLDAMLAQARREGMEKIRELVCNVGQPDLAGSIAARRIVDAIDEAIRSAAARETKE
jgi:hypothetical protein